MPRKPNGKRVVDARGGVSVRAKNGNGQGSVFFAEKGKRAYVSVKPLSKMAAE